MKTEKEHKREEVSADEAIGPYLTREEAYRLMPDDAIWGHGGRWGDRRREIENRKRGESRRVALKPSRSE